MDEELKALIEELEAAALIHGEAGHPETTRLFAKAAEALRAPAWQDISTAPKDGTEFDIWCVKREGYTNYPARIANCRHNEGVLEYLHSHGWFALKGAWEGREVIITHWMPRPEPPTDEGEK